MTQPLIRLCLRALRSPGGNSDGLTVPLFTFSKVEIYFGFKAYTYLFAAFRFSLFYYISYGRIVEILYLLPDDTGSVCLLLLLVGF